MKIFEILKQTKAAVGATNFSRSTFSDPHIKRVIDHISKETGKPVKKIEDEISEKLKEVMELHSKAPLLYHTIILNILENEVFKALKNVPVKGAPEFNPIIFSKLLRMIKQEHPRQFIPLRSFINYKSLHNPRYIFLPNEDPKIEKMYGKGSPRPIETAAATEHGDFIFNTKFMQDLLNFGHLKGLKPKSDKYENNGGDIPPEYGYIEFLIMHELMHYTFGDFYYQKTFNTDAQIGNWVGDFRSNYDLVKNGHEQLPMGLFNDLINLDRQRNWKEMYDVVKAEFDKLTPPEQGRVKKHWGDIEGGDHAEPSDEKGTPKEAEDGEKIARRKSEKVDVKSKEGKGEGEGEGEEEGKRNESPRGGRGTSKADTPHDIYQKAKPSMTWRDLIAKLIKTASVQETSYRKPHRRSLSRAHMAAQIGAAAIKPGEITSNESLLKLVIVVDSSGSMSSEIGQVYANLEQLVKEYSSELPLGFVLVKFSDSHKMFLCSVEGGGSYKEITGKKIDNKEPLEKGSLKKLFSEHYGSSTNFDEKLTNNLVPFVKDGFNVLIITDNDIIAPRNKEEFNKFYKKSNGQVYLIAANKEAYHSIIEALRDKASRITHM